MIKKLQIKFILIIMMIMTTVLLLIFGSINISMFKSGEKQSIRMMHDIALNNGGIPFRKAPSDPNPIPPDKMPLPQTYFSAKLNNNNELIDIILDKNLSLSQDEIKILIESVTKKNISIGKLNGFHFLVQPKEYGKIIVFLDNSMENNMNYRLLWTTIGIGSASLFVIFIVALFLSSWATKPVKIAFELQKQFIGDASHELKTPLTVIATNADVLSNEIGKNQWLEYIKTEVERMSSLVNNLLYLTKADSMDNVNQMVEFDLSNAMMSCCLPFESVAYENSKNLTLDIAQNIYYLGDESRIKQVVVILLDNAIKNSNENGEIRVSLKIYNNKKVITVFNTGEGIDEKDKEKIFERFYRSDSSRARETGGYGLGLSIAKTIIEAHKGKIFIKCEKGKNISFIVTL